MAITQGFVLGLVGSLHCIAMCGPIAIMLPAGGTGRTSFLTGRILYNVGRLLTYTTLGLGAGLVGRMAVVAGCQQVLSIGLGLLIVLSVLGPAVVRRVLSNPGGVVRLQALLKSAFVSFLRRRSLLSLALLGIANGLLPCGLVYVALAAAATIGGVTEGAFLMTGFGIGTIPVMLMLSIVGEAIPLRMRQKLAVLIPVMTVVVGALLIARGMNLGIPYISPVVPAGVGASEAECCH